MFALPNESGVCSSRPWLSTSHGERPSSEPSSITIPSANANSPIRSQALRAATPPRILGARW